MPPRRVVTGIDSNRLALVLAVLARHGGLGLGASDVFVNVVGGVRIDEPGADLAVALAGADGAPPACFGEIGLTGELWTVAHADRRAAEARKFGLRPVIGPVGSGATEAATLHEALRLALPRPERAAA